MLLDRAHSTILPALTPFIRPQYSTRSLFYHTPLIKARRQLMVTARMSSVTIMQSANTLRNAMESGPAMGIWQMLPGSNMSRLIAGCGPSWILVDQEHGNIDDGAMHEAVAAIAATGVSPIVRIPDNQGWMVKRALDAGAHGVLVPLLYTVDDAERLVKSAKFPPWGQRGFGSPFPMERFSRDLTSSQYLQQANDALLTCVQIETKEALENVEGIANVKGIDVLFVGPFDLGNNIGRPVINGVMHEELQAAIAKVQEVAEKAGKKSGIFCTSGEQGKKYADFGFDMVNVATDMMIMPTALGQALAVARGQSEVPKLTGPYGK